MAPLVETESEGAMGLVDLNHFSITVAPDALDGTARFYTDVLGLRLGERPAFAFPGRWLYCGDTAVVHLLGTGAPGEAPPDTGRLDHIAFRATGLVEMRERLKQTGVEFRERAVPGGKLHQVFVRDPNGILIELNFPARE
jgi:catechol 2,3-dioxygenase-like lactoylglutathione lyase family enzyme